MKTPDPKEKQDKDKQEKPIKPVEKTPPVPERPKPNVIRAQKAANDENKDSSGNDDNG